jgi:UDP-N-acetylglucosamine 2-epimerase (non-hydrolysing)
MRSEKILCVVGARPNLMKIAPIVSALAGGPEPCPLTLVHTGQHYGEAMNKQFFAALRIPAPDVNLEVGSGSHATQTAEVMRRFEPVLEHEQPGAVLVVGDVNSTLACALVAAKKGVPLIHVEAGLRSFDRTMPEEINRVLTDQISELLFTTEREARSNLLREGIADYRIHFVGNVMIDSVLANLDRAVPAARTLREMGVAPEATRNGFTVVTLHRPSNVDDARTLKSLLTSLAEISETLPVVFPLHPRTRGRIEAFGLWAYAAVAGLVLTPPLGYFEMLGLMKDARVVLTDSGGIQEETTALGVPCITLRDNTERPITVREGTNTLTGSDPDRIRAVFGEIMQTGGKAGRIPELWDGAASERIARVLRDWLRGVERRRVA